MDKRKLGWEHKKASRFEVNPHFPSSLNTDLSQIDTRCLPNKIRSCYYGRHRLLLILNLVGWTYSPSDKSPRNNDVIIYFLSAAVAILKKNILCGHSAFTESIIDCIYRSSLT